MDPSSQELLRRYLRQRLEAGERTLFLGELTAHDALALGSGTPSSGQAVGPPVAVTSPATPSEAPSESARVLRVIGDEAAGCTKCGLHASRQSVVFGEGNAAAELVVVGEAPGFYEDRSGRPFVGRAGKLLDLLLMSIGLPRDTVYICNVLKCRPPENRNPTPAEVACCSPFLHRQLEVIAPRVLLAVGNFAVQTLLETDRSIGTLRGRVHTYRGIPLVAAYHPAYLLRSGSSIRASWHDFQLARRVLDGSVPQQATALTGDST